MPDSRAPVTPGPWRLARGATVEPDGSVTFSVWAPRASSLAVRIIEGGVERAGAIRAELPLERDEQGVWSVRAGQEKARAGDDYLFVLPDIGARPDPVSRWQPAGVHAPSRIVDPNAFTWTDQTWRGRSRGDLIIYELHVGTFTPEGTFAGVIGKLPYLRELGVTAVELMPVAAFPGTRNWGYDGVYLYAPHEAYGGPNGLKRLVDACHQHGLALVLDVVYNHLGPEGNYLADFGGYFSDRYRTPWGGALNFDGPDSDEVRRFFVDNALYWLTEYHVDGLRLDAIHGIFDVGARPILREIADRFHAEAQRLGRSACLIGESDLNDPRVFRDAERGGYGLDAQWSDDFHHALHAVLTGARRGYFADFGEMGQLAKAIKESFVYDGQYAPHRRRRHGAPAARDAGEHFVIFIQNHDQVANGYQGRRLAEVAGPERQKVAAALLFSTPGLPLLFQGEERADPAPFDYFTSHTDPALAQAVRDGRHAEYLHLLEEGADARDSTVWADPQDEATFQRSKLRWDVVDDAAHADMLAFYGRLISLRRRLPAMHNNRKDLTRVHHDDVQRWIAIERRDPSGSAVVTVANLGDRPVDLPLPEIASSWRLALATLALAAFPEMVGAGARVPLAPATALIFESA